MYKRSNILHNLSWTARMSKERKYLPPKNLWEEFLYAMSYSRGSLVLDPKIEMSVARAATYRELITQATTISIPESPIYITHRNKANTRSAITQITPLTPEPVR